MERLSYDLGVPVARGPSEEGRLGETKPSSQDHRLSFGLSAIAWRKAMAHEWGMVTLAPEPAPLFFDVHVFACTNRRPDGHPRGSCAAGGSEKLRDYMKVRAKELGIPRIRINTAGCLDRCELGPCIVIYPEGVWYRIGSTMDVDRVLEEHVIQRRRVDDLLLPLRD